MALFLIGMVLVPAAAGAASFLLAWEMMAIGSTILLMAEHIHQGRVSSAALWYAVMSQLSFVALLGGFAALSAAAGSTTFADMTAVSPASGLAVCAFILFVLGFGSKSGLVPLHVWLPKAHPEAPSHVSAAMSAAMVNMGVYGILLVCVRILPGGPSWWGILLMILGGLSAVYGILQASVSSDVKVLLAYSTTENMGLIFLAIGSSLLLTSFGVTTVAAAVLLAALLLVVSHSAFKLTLFLAAGSVLHATGVRDLDHLGGLGRRMPWTAGAFGIASLGAAALPISSGFVAEWMLLQSLIHGAAIHRPSEGVLVSIAMPLAVAVVALTAGLAVLTFVKAYGIAFLARARTPAAKEATEAPVMMRVVMVLGAALVVGLGLVPGWVASALTATIPSLAGTATDPSRLAGLPGISVPHLGVLLDPVALLAVAAVLTIVIAVVTIRLAHRHTARTVSSVWGGGGDRMRPRMQYTATSYAEPVLRVFDDVLKPSLDVTVTHAGESRYLVDRVLVHQDLRDVIERRVYRPVLTLADRVGVAARRLQNGSIHWYITYSLVAFLVVVVLARL
jgi:formate hydrogenlyase subunit 3/multisubunit Na+/H+ antiporter MnhD subunit